MADLILSYSQRSTLWDCNRKWYYQYILKLAEHEDTVHTVFGGIVHEILQLGMNGLKDGELKKEEVPEFVFEIARTWEWPKLVLVKFDYVLLEYLFNIYCYRALPIVLDRIEEVIGVELELTCDNYTGFIDLVYRDEEDYIHLLDWKTSSSEYPAHKIITSPQLLGYAWLYTRYTMTVPTYLEYLVLPKKPNRFEPQHLIRGVAIKDLQDWSEQTANDFVMAQIIANTPEKAIAQRTDNCWAYYQQCPFYERCFGRNYEKSYAEITPSGISGVGIADGHF